MEVYWIHSVCVCVCVCACVCVCVCVLGQHDLSPKQETHVPRVVTKPNLHLPLTQRLWLRKIQCLFQGEQVANAQRTQQRQNREPLEPACGLSYGCDLSRLMTTRSFFLHSFASLIISCYGLFSVSTHRWPKRPQYIPMVFFLIIRKKRAWGWGRGWGVLSPGTSLDGLDKTLPRSAWFQGDIPLPVGWPPSHQSTEQ